MVHGKPKAVADNVKEIGKVVGVKFNCDTDNSFNLLTKEGRREWRAVSGGEMVTEMLGDDEGVKVRCLGRGIWRRWGGWKVLMKILTYNVRGLGGGEKRVEVRRLVCDKNPSVLCI